MKISKEAKRISREAFRASLADGCLDAAKVRELSDGIVRDKPRHYAQILKEFARLVRLELQRRHAVIQSALPLDPGTADALVRSIHGSFGADITTEFKVTPALIGGLRVQVGSDVWDGTIFNRLQLFKDQL